MPQVFFSLGDRIHHQLARIEIDPKASHSTMTYYDYDYNLKNKEETHVAFVFLRFTIWFERFWVNHELDSNSIHHANPKDTSRQLRPGGSPIMVRAAIWWPVNRQIYVFSKIFILGLYNFCRLLLLGSSFLWIMKLVILNQTTSNNDTQLKSPSALLLCMVQHHGDSVTESWSEWEWHCLL